MQKENNFYFFLGGADLEMQEIRNILISRNIKYENNKLSWNNAYWKNYKKIIEKKINEGYTIVGVELICKNDRPENEHIIDIDHHNYNRCKPAAIEQVAKMLDVKLNEYQKYVALNDKGYIPAMLQAGVSLKNIENIRHKDREVQGLDESEFEIAKKMQEKQLTYKEDADLYIIKVANEIKSFTPYTDAFFFNKLNECLKKKKSKDCGEKLAKIKLIIYNDNKFIYSGNIPTKILEKYKEEIQDCKAFFGGSEPYGYFGFTEEYMKEERVENILNKWKKIFIEEKTIINKNQHDKMHSYHIFLFPFRWEI